MSDIISIKHKVQKSLKVRIYPTAEQEILILKALGSYRFVYNQHKAEKDNFYNENIKDKNLSKEEIAAIYKNFKPKTQKQFVMNLNGCEIFLRLQLPVLLETVMRHIISSLSQIKEKEKARNWVFLNLNLERIIIKVFQFTC